MKLAATATVLLLAVCSAAAASPAGQAQRAPAAETGAAPSTLRATLDRYCVTCHNHRVKTAGLMLDLIDVSRPAQHAEVLEKVLRKVQTGGMPPVGAPRPDAVTARALTTGLATALDRATSPTPGRTLAMHRLSRTEYGNVIRDLLGLKDLPQKIALESLLPQDNVAAGFDNLADLLFMSPTVMERYLSAAMKIADVAIGNVDRPVIDGDDFAPPPGFPQSIQLDDFPLGTRGGAVAATYIPVTGEYLLNVALSGPLLAPEQLEISINDERVHLFEGSRSSTASWWTMGRQRLSVKLPLRAGAHRIALAFTQSPLTIDEAVVRKRLRPGGRSETVLTGERQRPSISSATLNRPSGALPPDRTAVRDRIFVCRPDTTTTEAACARKILSTLARRAYRRPVTGTDLDDLLPFYEEGLAAGGFEEGIKYALERLLVSPQFLFRIEAPPAGVAPGATYTLGDIALASRLSFFLWSSMPDDTLLALAERGRLKNPVVLRQQIQRMLKDPRAKSLVANFAEQWLFLRDIDTKLMDDARFPNFDDGLRQSLRRETALFLESVLLENRSVVDLLRANYTFINERLAKHYGIPHVYGAHFRRVTFGPRDSRGGLLGHGSVLLLTSYGTRTSPVLRGKWILENLLSAPPPPPPPNIPALAEKTDSGKELTMREAMEEHRRNPLCAGCHAAMDPLGFALENFDAIGAWRTRGADGSKLDVSGVMLDGSKFEGLPGLRQVLVDTRAESFVVSFTERLLKYAIGRDLSYQDAPVVRKIVQDAARDNYAFYSLVRGVVASLPFQARMVSPAAGVPAETSAHKH